MICSEEMSCNLSWYCSASGHSHTVTCVYSKVVGEAERIPKRICDFYTSFQNDFVCVLLSDIGPILK